jgi:hypothetical protein
MDSSQFDSQAWYSDDENKLTLSVKGNGSQQSSKQSGKPVLGEFGKAVIFGKGRCLSQNGVKDNEQDPDGKNFEAGQTFSKIAGNQQRRRGRRSRDMDIPAFDSKDKEYWFTEYKYLRRLNKKLAKCLDRKNNKIKQLLEHVKTLSDLTNN